MWLMKHMLLFVLCCILKIDRNNTAVIEREDLLSDSQQDRFKVGSIDSNQETSVTSIALLNLGNTAHSQSTPRRSNDAVNGGATQAQTAQSNSNTTLSLFREIDRIIENDPLEQNARSILGGATTNEFLDSDLTSKQALDIEKQTLQILKNNQINPDFNANGDPVGTRASQIFQETVRTSGTCVYDSANSESCEETFREPSGRCTNTEPGKRTWGMVGTPYTRLLPSKYEDGVREVKKTEFKSSNLFKSPREISDKVLSTQVILNFDGISAHTMQWGQFISHEFTLIGELEENVACCPDKIFALQHGAGITPTSEQLATIREVVQELRGHVCIQIEHTNDSVFGDYICMEQTRSKPAPSHDCSYGPRQQINLVTHIFDGSAIYGSSLNEANNLRSLSGGKMKVQSVNGVTLPPPDHDSCDSKPVGRCPFAAGDHRINTTPNLIAEHTLFLVVHNKIAEQLSSLNPHWDDERLYQETRRIVTAIQGNIHYYEYLPIVLGETIINKYKLGSYDGFNPSVDPSILNELAGAAMRFGHSTIDGFISLIFDDGTDAFINLRPQFFNTTTIYEGGIRQCIRGLTRDVPWRVDRFFPSQMRDGLFNQDRDIASISINRGRDHGFASYMDYRRHYGLSIANGWTELSNITHTKNVTNGLKSVYTDVEDLELYTAGVTENPVAGGLVGELFANIIADGFSRTRKGDRFWFENGDSGLNKDQIDAIKGYKYNELLCEGSGIEQVPSKGFFTVNAPSVSLVQCSSLPKLNLSLWKETIVSSCAWKTTSISRCCAGEIVKTRNCEGESETCKCEGDTTITETCSCQAQDFKCIYCV